MHTMTGYHDNARESGYAIDDCISRLPERDVVASIWAGLNESPKRISSIYFYDGTGSKLFEEITTLPEYYPTRTEMALLDEHASAMAPYMAHRDVIEIGSGDCSKISRILQSVSEECRASLRYVPVDVSHAAIEESARLLLRRFPGLAIRGMVADFLTQIDLVPRRRKRCFLFLGGTVGNLSRRQGREYLAKIGALMRPGEALLLGVDRVKDKRVLEAAYNDSRGVTAAFNRNILKVVNDRAGTDFDPASFEHVAFYDEKRMRIEMHLRAVRDMTVSSPRFPRALAIARGEMIHTENSHKFTDAAVMDLAQAAGLTVEKFCRDPDEKFSLVQMIKTEEGIQ